MNAWNDWAKVAACAVLLGPAASLAEDFQPEKKATTLSEYLVTDQPDAPAAGAEVEPVDHEVIEDESVLVHTPLEVDGAALEAGVGEGMPCESCGAAGCISCCDGGVGCTGHGRRSGWHTAAGYFNRVLGDASPRWVGQVDALVLWQGNIPSRPILQSGTTVIDANQLQTVAAAGARYGLFLNLDQCYAIEGNYFNVASFAGEEKITPGNYVGVNMPAGFVPPSLQSDMLSTGQIQSAEMNWRRRPCGSPLTWLAGFRWVEWNQTLQIIDTANPAISMLDSQTGNDLYGGQIGADLLLWVWDNPNRGVSSGTGGHFFTVNGVAKGGVFYNTAYQRTSEAGIVGVQSAVADQTAFFGEVGFNGSVRLTNWLSWRAGYSLFWLSGVAVPADQLALVSTTAPATINTNGSVLLHGVTTGLEARW